MQYEMANAVIYNASTKTCLVKMADPDVKGSPVITVVIHHVNRGIYLSFLKHLEINTITVTGRLIKAKNGFIIDGDSPNTKIVDEDGQANLYDPVPEPPPVGPADSLK